MVRKEGVKMAKLIEIKNLRKSFGDKTVLKDVSLEAGKGDIIAVIGASGSGKSTMIRCIAGLENVDGGQILLNGEDMGNGSQTAGRIGMVFQNFNLFPHYTVKENIAKPLMTVKKTLRKEAEDIADELLAKVKLSEEAAQYPATLSGGQKQRLAIARCLAMNPEIIAFDEPTSSLDPELAHEVFQTIKELAGEGQTMFIVTHQINAIRSFATRVAFLKDGVIEAEGSCEEIFEKSDNENLKQFLNMVGFEDL